MPSARKATQNPKATKNNPQRTRGRPKNAQPNTPTDSESTDEMAAHTAPPVQPQQISAGNSTDGVMRAIQDVQMAMARQIQDLRTDIMRSVDEKINARDPSTTRRGRPHENEVGTECDTETDTVTPCTTKDGRPPRRLAAYTAPAPVPAPRRTQRMPAMMAPIPAYADPHYHDAYTDGDHMAATQPYYNPVGLPTDNQDLDNTDAINDLLMAAGTALGRKRGKAIFTPHKYVIRGDKMEKVGLGDATFPEYVAALCRMDKDPAVPQAWKEPMRDHLHQMATMASSWEWETCRLWSEQVFTMIDDGRLPHAWDDRYAIKDVQRDACAVGIRIGSTGKTQYHAKPYVQQTHSVSHQGGAHEHRQDYNRETDGKPCNAWNWGNECGFTASHGQHPERRLHICAWCANKYQRTNMHQERVCGNKKRFL